MRKDPTGRALQLLSLLQTHRWWRGAELAERLEITERSVRRDVDRLRELGYPVDATSGKHGGYRLATGAHLPPLVLDDDEAVAVAVGLRYAAEAAIGGMEEASLRALTTIEQLLPHRLRRRVSALHSSVTSMRRPAEDDVVDPEALSVLAAACRDREDVRFDYRRRDGTDSRRLVQPHQLVTAGRRWYLVAWDPRRDDWRTFRLDRLREPRPVGSRFTPREIPGGDAASFVASSLGSLFSQHRATLVVDAPFAELEGALRWVDHTPIETGVDSCVVQIRSEDLDWLALIVARIALTAPVAVIEPDELADTVMRLAANLLRAPEPGSPAPPAGPDRPGSAPSS
ncbi:helix-turn-helix transcriptional regulator [Cellulomonas sp.]|uniref:helix-turn-helix transcriptional regulator n=1 Tax=Cellulomonas sp. TaxID=40001 RepID=UPI003BAD72F3